MHKNREDESEFNVRLCRDVLVELFLFGNRRRLTKLERVGYRFHRVIENFFKQKPFIRLDLRINPRYLILGTIVGNKREILITFKIF